MPSRTLRRIEQQERGGSGCGHDNGGKHADKHQFLALCLLRRGRHAGRFVFLLLTDWRNDTVCRNDTICRLLTAIAVQQYGLLGRSLVLRRCRVVPVDQHRLFGRSRILRCCRGVPVDQYRLFSSSRVLRRCRVVPVDQYRLFSSSRVLRCCRIVSIDQHRFLRRSRILRHGRGVPIDQHGLFGRGGRCRRLACGYRRHGSALHTLQIFECFAQSTG